MTFTRNALWATFIAGALASPVPHILLPRQDVSECSLNTSDPASWAQSGASQLMEDWFNAHGTDNWLQAMESSITNTQSSLDCIALHSSDCDAPQTACSDYSRPAFHLIRVAASKAHTLFASMHEKLQNEILKSITSIDKLVLDFGPQTSDKPFKFVDNIATGVSIASTLAGMAGPEGEAAGTVLGMMSGVLSAATGAMSQPKVETDPKIFKASVSEQIGELFTTTSFAIENFNALLFGGKGNGKGGDMSIDQVVRSFGAALPGDNKDLHGITQIFARGAFLADYEDSELRAGVEQGLERVKQSLIAGILRAQNFYVFVNTELQPAQCTTTGSRVIDGKCMMLSQRALGKFPDTSPVDRDLLLKLDSARAGYNIDVAELYRNAYECNGGRLETVLNFAGGLPRCFYSLPVVSVAGPNACALIPSGLASAPGQPAGLKLTEYDCRNYA